MHFFVAFVECHEHFMNVNSDSKTVLYSSNQKIDFEKVKILDTESRSKFRCVYMTTEQQNIIGWNYDSFHKTCSSPQSTGDFPHALHGRVCSLILKPQLTKSSQLIGWRRLESATRCEKYIASWWQNILGATVYTKENRSRNNRAMRKSRKRKFSMVWNYTRLLSDKINTTKQMLRYQNKTSK